MPLSLLPQPLRKKNYQSDAIVTAPTTSPKKKLPK